MYDNVLQGSCYVCHVKLFQWNGFPEVLCLLYIWISITHLFISGTCTEVKVVAVFDAMMSGLPTHKEDFNGYSLWTRILTYCDLLPNEKLFFLVQLSFCLLVFWGKDGRVKLHLILLPFSCACSSFCPRSVYLCYNFKISLISLVWTGFNLQHLDLKWLECSGVKHMQCTQCSDIGHILNISNLD